MLGLQWVGQSLLAIILVCSLHTRTMSNAALTAASVIVEEIVYSWSTPNNTCSTVATLIVWPFDLPKSPLQQ